MIVPFDELIEVLGVVAGSADASLVGFLHKKVERLIKKYVRYNVEQASYSHYLPFGVAANVYEALAEVEYTPSFYQGLNALQLPELPVRVVSNVYVNRYAWSTVPTVPAGTWPNESLLLDGSFRLDVDETGKSSSGLLLRRYGQWPIEPRTVRVDYTAGWSTAELQDDAGDFQLAVYQAVEKFLTEIKVNRPPDDTIGTGAVASEALDGLVITWSRAGDNFGLADDLPRSVKRMLEDRVRKDF